MMVSHVDPLRNVLLGGTVESSQVFNDSVPRLYDGRTFVMAIVNYSRSIRSCEFRKCVPVKSMNMIDEKLESPVFS